MILATVILLMALPPLVWFAAMFDRIGTGRGAVVMGPIRNGAALLLRPNTPTEAPDRLVSGAGAGGPVSGAAGRGRRRQRSVNRPCPLGR